MNGNNGSGGKIALYEFNGVTPRVHSTAFVHPAANVTGQVIIGAECFVGPGASIRGDFGAIFINDGTNVQDNCTIHVGGGKTCVLETNVHVGHGAVVHGAYVERNALIGINAVVMDDARICDSAVVAASAFVKANALVARGTLVAGLPARFVRSLTNEDLAALVDSARLYRELAAVCLKTLRRVDC
jgi:carbonic anhydrase/acetyltransferase-like protein (isoleucine patch superfamily)